MSWRWKKAKKPRSLTFEVITDGRVAHTVTITGLGSEIHIDQPVVIDVSGERHTYHLRNTSLRWVK